MKIRYIFGLLLIPLLLISCNDGDIEFEKINFEGAEVRSCVRDTTTTVLYKIKGKHTLILKFKQNLLTNKEGTVTADIPNQCGLIFRSFNGNITDKYFCSDLPPSSPNVESEILATGGTVKITTVLVNQSSSREEQFKHLITITDLVLVNSGGEKLVDSKFDFGDFTTQK